MRKRFVFMLLSLAMILAVVSPVAMAADNQLVISEEDAFLWESRSDRKTLYGVNPEWYKTNVTDKGIQNILIKIPASTETIRKDFGGSYATIGGYSTDGKELVPVYLNCQQVFVDFSAATNLKTIGVQAFFQVSGLTGEIDLSKTQVEVIEGNAFKKTGITGVILPTTLKRVGNDDPGTTGSHAPVFEDCSKLEFIRVAGGSSTAVFELPTNLAVIGNSGFYLEGTKIEQTMINNPFVIKIPKSLKKMQHTAIGFNKLEAVRKAQYVFEETDFTGTVFQNDCLFNSTYTNNWGVARFASKEAYNSFVEKYPDSSKFYGYPTYEFDLTFKNKETQTKLWGQSIQYEKDGAANYWKRNTSYALPDKPDTAAVPAAGQVGYWELNGDELTADSKLPATPVATELTAVWKTRSVLVEPTVYYTLNGVRQGKLTSFDKGLPLLEVPRINGNPGKIGVQIDHPLLKSNSGTDDNYVYFKYRWIDVQRLRLGARSTATTPETGSGIYNTNATADVNDPNEAYKEITIRDSGDNRVAGNGNYTFYNCEIYGYYVHDGAEKLFYVSNGLGRAYLRLSGPDYTTDDMFCICAKFLDVWTITFDLNGGTAPEGVDYSPVQVKKGKVYPTPKEPLKPGYTCWGWKEKDGTREYYLGMAIDKDKDVTLVAQYDPNRYTIKYDANLPDATGTVENQKYVYDTADFKLTEDTFASTTKAFRGWSLTQDAVTASYTSGAAIDDALKDAMVASADGTVTLYAVWKDKTAHIVAFNAGANGSFVNPSDPLIHQMVIEGRFVTGAPAVAANPGYTFEGWKLEGDTADKVYAENDIKAMVIDRNVTFNASYTYEATGSLTLEAAKTVNGKTPTEAQKYDFELKSGANTPAVSQTKQNDGGKVTFDAIRYTLADVGKTYTYTVRETTPDSADMKTDKTVYTVTVTNIADRGDGQLSASVIYNDGTKNVDEMIFRNEQVATTGFKVTKVWQDGNEGAISLTLYANGQKMEPQPACNRSGDTYTYTGLPMYDAKGNPILYAAKERPVSGYMTIYKNVAPYESESSFIYDGGTIINRAVTQIAVRMVWKGMDEGEKRPDITLTLYCNGKAINRKPKLGANGWYHFYNLPISSEPYYVVETPVSGFMTLYQNVGGYANVEGRAYDGGTITNSKLPKTGDENHIERYVALLLISLVALYGYGMRKKRDQ